VLKSRDGGKSESKLDEVLTKLNAIVMRQREDVGFSSLQKHDDQQ